MPSTTMSLPRADGVSFVVPVRNGARWLPRVLPSLLAQDAGVPIEVVMVEDGSGDGSAEILARASAADARVKIVPGTGSGAAAALNAGIQHARYPLIAQVDQDVVLEPGWLAALIPHLGDLTVAAAQGYYETDPAAPLSARVMSLDLEQRYERIEGADTDHVCTGNTLYRASALAAIGGFDESLGYGYDNDVSYRLKDAGFRLIDLPRGSKPARSGGKACGPIFVSSMDSATDVSTWWRGTGGDSTGDSVSPPPMMVHPVVLAAALAGRVRRE